MQPTLDRDRLTRNGFVVVELLCPETLAALRSRYEALDLDGSHEFFASCHDLPAAEALVLDLELRELAGAAVRALLPQHEPFLASYISKGAGGGSRCDYHQDLTYTDERHSRAVLVWAPLVDTDAHLGGMRVVVGSHRWTDGIRAGSMRALPTAPLQQAFDRLAVDVPVPAGSALVYDPALVHGSTPNHGQGVRPVLAVASAPVGAALVHFHQSDSGRLEGFCVDDHFASEQSLFTRPEGYPEFASWADAVETADLERAIAAADGGATATSPAPPTPRSGAPRRRSRVRRILRR